MSKEINDSNNIESIAYSIVLLNKFQSFNTSFNTIFSL